VNWGDQAANYPTSCENASIVVNREISFRGDLALPQTPVSASQEDLPTVTRLGLFQLLCESTGSWPLMHHRDRDCNSSAARVRDRNLCHEPNLGGSARQENDWSA